MPRHKICPFEGKVTFVEYMIVDNYFWINDFYHKKWGIAYNKVKIGLNILRKYECLTNIKEKRIKENYLINSTLRSLFVFLFNPI